MSGKEYTPGYGNVLAEASDVLPVVEQLSWAVRRTNIDFMAGLKRRKLEHISFEIPKGLLESSQYFTNWEAARLTHRIVRDQFEDHLEILFDFSWTSHESGTNRTSAILRRDIGLDSFGSISDYTQLYSGDKPAPSPSLSPVDEALLSKYRAELEHQLTLNELYELRSIGLAALAR